MDNIYSNWLKYILSGLVPSGIELGLLFVLVEYIDLWYLLATTLVYTCSFIVSFLLRKFWVFSNTERQFSKQASLYALLFGFNIIMNIALLYVLVEHAHWHYLTAQLLSIIILGIVGFLFNQKVIFRHIE